MTTKKAAKKSAKKSSPKPKADSKQLAANDKPEEHPAKPVRGKRLRTAEEIIAALKDGAQMYVNGEGGFHTVGPNGTEHTVSRRRAKALLEKGVLVERNGEIVLKPEPAQ